jgi:hypothetical protein
MGDTGRWRVPDTIPAALRCRSLFIPDDPEIRGAVNGALAELIYPQNWEQTGQATAEEMAAVMATMFFDYVESDCESLGMTLLIDNFAHRVPQNSSGGGIAANTDTVIPFNDDSEALAGNVTLTASIFTVPPGVYLVDMYHTCFAGQGKVRAAYVDDISPNIFHEGLTMEQLASQNNILVLSGIFIRNVEVNLTFQARSTVARPTDFFGRPMNVTGRPETYGHVRFVRLSDAP